MTRALRPIVAVPTSVPDLERFAADVAARLNAGAWAASAVHRRRWPVFVARAPGRLDVMGGIADYSGALVLQWPIREATRVALRPWRRTRVSRSPRSGATASSVDCDVPLDLIADAQRVPTTRCARGSPRDPRATGPPTSPACSTCSRASTACTFRRRRRHPDRVGRAGGQGRELVGGDRGRDDGGGACRVARVDRADGCARSAASRSRT